MLIRLPNLLLSYLLGLDIHFLSLFKPGFWQSLIAKFPIKNASTAQPIYTTGPRETIATKNFAYGHKHDGKH